MAAAFSYAQAAKGIATTQPSKTAELSTTASKPDEQTSTPEVSTDAPASKPDAPNDVENVTVNGEDEFPIDSKADLSGTSTPNAATAQTSTSSKDEEGLNTPNGTSEAAWDKQSQASGSDKPDATTDGAKEKSSEKEKPAPPKPLKAAPLPAVNIWQQRMEAHEAKAKAVAALKPTAPKNSKPTSDASSISGESQDQSKASSKKKGGDAADGGKDRKKADGTKGREEGATTVPPVGDAALWPTPHVAQGEEKKKVQDKPDKGPIIRTNGKEKWMPVPYVPTAVFNTPLPSAARRGGRSARGGRENARNGTHGGAGGATAEKAAPAQAAQGSAAKQTASGDRGRNEPNSARANSLPAPSRRSNSADNGTTDARKQPATDRIRGPKGADNSNAAVASKNVNGGESFPRHAKPFPRNHDGAQKGGDHNPKNLSVDPNAVARSASNNERRFENGPKSADFTGAHADRKDKEFSRESRADRGRGSHRGRGGGHAAYNGAQMPHFPNNHMTHHNFSHHKSFGFNDRQRSQQPGMTNGSRGHAMTMRSPSLPNSNTMYGVYPFPADINTMYSYQPMQAGPMSAVPYQQYMEPFSVMSMISMQLEYYFSVDNLCKDLYLRKHMDSQGFVSLNVIASFKRIKSLTEDFEMIRHVSRQLRNVEYFTGEDGIDRLRPREKWEQWVLPLDQRDASAQHHGPTSGNQNEASNQQNHVEGATNGYAPKALHSLPNGTSEPRTSKTPLSSAAPEFSPSNGINNGSEISNVRIPFLLPLRSQRIDILK
ncbi:hypothetical protein P175DRAFT_0529537 [Aspergillus ochraceoroseus IBT 24754]|uniref:HTH La-type RNA-binding domain-containing protein n=3 Tax=Aspergillus subgen. Nidulantes TaxID=2720870 RepID=A0A0F8V0I8_9EURO|nr:uncharacterized protein P175DRAFT_0529537 [Aspergillus ochraceoroseus IBT 24754]KKK23127.1 hypothetical protein AOCH_007732 [Aspergillus ochraceoroseus]KKK25278.1 hypothetical protein ARAM_000699 [Aspergillus rambellii]PTU22478.1 hypothetical protein P175DRAFT_0529537 [Aspergillus ochraceoroseus IBT 24754]